MVRTWLFSDLQTLCALTSQRVLCALPQQTSYEPAIDQSMHAQGPDGRGGRVKTANSSLGLRILSNNTMQSSTSGKHNKVSSHSVHVLVRLNMSRGQQQPQAAQILAQTAGS